MNVQRYDCLPDVYIPEIGMYFRGTFAVDHEDNARQMAKVHNLIVKPFGVDLKTIAPAPVTWERVSGWSTWCLMETL